MRTKKYNIIAILVLLLFINPSVSSAELGGMGSFYTSSYEYGYDNETTSTNTTQKNLRLSVSNNINELLSYNLEVINNYSDSGTEDPYGLTTTSSQKTLEPGFSLSLRNPMYEASAGFKRREILLSGNTGDDTRRISEYYYSLFRLNPVGLPSLSAGFNRENNNDGVSVNNTNDRYNINSSYTLPSDVFKLRMYLNYTHTLNQDPLKVNYKSVSDDFSGNYNMGYSRKFLDSKLSLSVGYDGNFTRGSGESFSAVTGNVLFERKGVGLSAQGTVLDPDVDNLLSDTGLTDADIIASTGIGLSSPGGEYQNIGIQVSKVNAVDRLYIYVNKNVSSDLSLTLPGNWKVYWSDFNQVGTWNQISISSVGVSVFDSPNNIYRYEIIFSASKNAVYFKAVNMAASGVSNVFVTQIEAYGIEVVPESGVIEYLSTSIFQKVSLLSTYQPFSKLRFSINCSIDKSDQNSELAFGSISSVVTSIFSKSKSNGDDPDYSSRIKKSVAFDSTWLTHRLLTTYFRTQFSQSYDNDFTTDSASNSYSLQFASNPIQNLSANLAFSRSEAISFEVKESIIDSVFLTIGSRLYRDLNMVTDMGYTRTENLVSKSESSSKYISGVIDTDLTRKLSATLRYSFGWSATDTDQTQSRSGAAIISYRLGKFLDFSGNLDYSATSEGSSVVKEVLFVNWRPIPVVQLSTNYTHSNSQPDSFTADSVSFSGTWQIKKFASFHTAYSYEQKQQERKIKNSSLNAGLSLRF